MRTAALWAAALAAACSSSPTPTPPAPTPPVVYDAGTLEESACHAAATVCGTDEDECLRQVVRLRHAYYAELSDQDLQCWVMATTPAAMRACGNGSCQ